MTQPYPFYDQLLAEVEHKQQYSIDWKSVSNTINSMNTQHADIIHSLILHHFLLGSPNLDPEQLTQSNVKLSLQQPYGYRLFGTGKGLTFTVNRIPPVLQAIINTYVEKASK